MNTAKLLAMIETLWRFIHWGHRAGFGGAEGFRKCGHEDCVGVRLQMHEAGVVLP